MRLLLDHLSAGLNPAQAARAAGVSKSYACLFGASGTFIAVPDAWWPEAGVAAEVDSKQWHLSPADWERTLRRHAQMSSHGILVLHFTPGQIRAHPAAVAAAIADTLRIGRARPALRVSARPGA